MSFNRADIRRSMDVFTRDNTYLGTVLAIQAGPLPGDRDRVNQAPLQSSEVSGELLGPMPTAPLGNAGPRHQSAIGQYGTTREAAPPLGYGTMTVGKWWLFNRRTLPLEAVQSVALERVVLKLRRDELS